MASNAYTNVRGAAEAQGISLLDRGRRLLSREEDGPCSRVVRSHRRQLHRGGPLVMYLFDPRKAASARVAKR